MPLFTLPRFEHEDALDARRLDAMFKALAEIMNGGMTVDNVASSYKIPVAGFAEGRALFAFKGFADANSVVGSEIQALLGVIPSGSLAALIGLGFVLKYVNFPATNRQIDILVGASPGTLIYRHRVPTREVPVTIAGTQYLIGFAQPHWQTLTFSNTSVWAKWGFTGSSPIGSVTAFFAAAHE